MINWRSVCFKPDWSVSVTLVTSLCVIAINNSMILSFGHFLYYFVRRAWLFIPTGFLEVCDNC